MRQGLGLQLLLTALALLAPGVAAAGAPAAHVVELADWREGFPPPCTLARIRGRSLVVSRALAGAVQAGGNERVEVPPGAGRVEEADRIVLVRALDGCHVLAGRGTLPPADRAAARLGIDLGRLGWRATADVTLVVETPGASRRLARGRGCCLGPRPTPETGCPVRLHYYGVLPMFFENEPGLAENRVREAVVGEVVSGRFSGTGDEAVYRLHIPGPGTLLVEHRSDAGPGALQITLEDAAGRTHTSGLIRFRTETTLLVRVAYLGTGPASFDVGLLFEAAPQGPADHSGSGLAPGGPSR